MKKIADDIIIIFFLFAFIFILEGCKNNPTDGGGVPIRIPTIPPRVVDEMPSWSPDGNKIAYTYHPQNDTQLQNGIDQIWLLDLTRMTKTFLTEGLDPVWSPDGKMIAYVKNNDIHIIDLATKQITRLTSWSSCFFPSWSPDGKKIAFDAITNWPTVPGDSAGIWVMNTKGSKKRLVIKGRSPHYSPDGAQFVYVGGAGSAKGTETQIWLADTSGSNQKQLTNNSISNWDPIWSPNGSFIAWGSSGNKDNAGIWIMNADGTGEHLLVGKGGHPTWSPDGKKIAFHMVDNSGRYIVLWIINTDGTGLQQLTQP